MCLTSRRGPPSLLVTLNAERQFPKLTDWPSAAIPRMKGRCHLPCLCLCTVCKASPANPAKGYFACKKKLPIPAGTVCGGSCYTGAGPITAECQPTGSWKVLGTCEPTGEQQKKLTGHTHFYSGSGMHERRFMCAYCKGLVGAAARAKWCVCICCSLCMLTWRLCFVRLESSIQCVPAVRRLPLAAALTVAAAL